MPHRHDVFTGCYTATYTPWAPLPIMEPVLQTEFGRQKYTTMMICDEPHILENGYNYQRGFDAWDWIRGQEHDNWVTTPGIRNLNVIRRNYGMRKDYKNTNIGFERIGKMKVIIFREEQPPPRVIGWN